MNKGQVIRVIDKGGKLSSCGKHSPRVAIIEESGYPKYLMLDNAKIDKFELLALAEKVSWDDPIQGREILRMATGIFCSENDWVFNEICDAVTLSVLGRIASRNSEYWLHGFFKKNVKDILGEHVDIVDGPRRQRHQPDAWVSVNGKLLPVEIKKGSFNKTALNQLMRYIKVFEAKQGIAIAEELTVELPPNIIFVSCADWRDRK